jgi:uncharacterized Tic20 family protein
MTETIVNLQTDTTTSDQRFLAALAHGSTIFSFMGPIIPALVWTFQRRKAPYVAFHALQAMGYQMLTFWVGMAAYLLVIMFGMLLTIPLASLSRESATDFVMAPFAMQGSVVLFTVVFMGGYVLLGIAGGILCLLGRDFKYPILGKHLEKYLGRGANPTDALDETREDQWVAGMGHASAILMMWGTILPLLVWLTQKDRSPRLRFQSLQALVYQLIATVAYFVFMAVYMVVFMGMFAGMIPLLNTNGQGVSTPVGVFFIISMIVLLLLMLVVSLALPTYHLFSMIAGIQVVKGKDYLYPLLGKLLAQRLERQNQRMTVETKSGLSAN